MQLNVFVYIGKNEIYILICRILNLLKLKRKKNNKKNL